MRRKISERKHNRGERCERVGVCDKSVEAARNSFILKRRDGAISISWSGSSASSDRRGRVRSRRRRAGACVTCRWRFGSRRRYVIIDTCAGLACSVRTMDDRW